MVLGAASTQVHLQHPISGLLIQQALAVAPILPLPHGVAGPLIQQVSIQSRLHNGILGLPIQQAPAPVLFPPRHGTVGLLILPHLRPAHLLNGRAGPLTQLQPAHLLSGQAGLLIQLHQRPAQFLPNGPAGLPILPVMFRQHGLAGVQTQRRPQPVHPSHLS